MPLLMPKILKVVLYYKMVTKEIPDNHTKNHSFAPLAWIMERGPDQPGLE